MEVNGGGKSFIISESSGAYFDGFYAAVDAFGRAITDLENNRIDDSLLMFLMVLAASLTGSRRQRMAQESHFSQPLRAQVGCT